MSFSSARISNFLLFIILITSNSSKLLVAISTVSVGLLIAVIVLGVLLGNSNSNNQKPKQEALCTTKACINAGKILRNYCEKVHIFSKDLKKMLITLNLSYSKSNTEQYRRRS